MSETTNTTTTTEGVDSNAAPGSSPAAAQPTPAAGDQQVTPAPTPNQPPVPPAAGETEPATPAADATPSDGETTTASAEGAPETYEAFQTTEGQPLPSDQSRVYEAIARALDLPQERAQEMVNAAIPVLQGMHETNVASAQAAWENELRADERLGGPRYDDTIRAAGEALNGDASGAAFGELLDETGLRNHPAVVRYLNWVGSSITPETTVVDGDPPGASDANLSPEERMARGYARNRTVAQS